jgi:hypothetical protein
MLDVQAAFDSGSYSALANGVYFKGTPLHINDTDISPDDLVPASIRYTFTDMNFSSAAYEMLRHMRKMIHVPVDADGQPLAHQNWALRHSIVETVLGLFAKDISNTATLSIPSSALQEWFARL